MPTGSEPGQLDRASAPVPLAAVADVRVVEGPSMIKSENGMLRAYIQLRVREERDEVGFVEEARRVVAERVKLPAGMYLEWSGTFEHQVRAQKTLRLVFPAVIATILIILYLTHKSWTDALLLMTSVLGALAGGAIFQWLFGFKFSVAVQVGYIACFGMAVETGVVMLVYLREAIEERGGLAADRLDRRAAAGHPGGGHPSPAAQAADRGRRDHLDRPDALGQRRRGRGDPSDGRAGARRPADRRRGDRRVPARALLRRAETAVAQTAWSQSPRRAGRVARARSSRRIMWRPSRSTSGRGGPPWPQSRPIGFRRLILFLHVHHNSWHRPSPRPRGGRPRSRGGLPVRGRCIRLTVSPSVSLTWTFLRTPPRCLPLGG